MHIYFDNASTTPLDPEVLETMLPFMTENFGNPSSIHYHGRIVRAAIEEARTKVARLLNASTGEIFFMSSATEANNMALLQSVKDLGVERIISSPGEHHCILHSLQYLEKHHNTEVISLALNSLGQIDHVELEAHLAEKEKKTLVTLMHANNEIGTLLDIQQLSEICARYGALFHSDTVQSVGKFPLDLQEIKAHFISGSAHKFFGPKGVGFLYINENVKINTFLYGGGQERNMRPGTENVYGIVGLAKALELAVSQIDERKAYILSLRNHLKSALQQYFEDIQYNGTQERNFHYGILNISLPKNIKTDLLMMNLDVAGISASAGSACTSGVENRSHVLAAINAPENRNSVRFSFSHLNTIEEVNILVEQMRSFLPERMEVS